MASWLFITAAVLVVWLVLGVLWKKVLKPYFKREIVEVRTSVVPEEHHSANMIDDNICCFCLAEPKNLRVVATCSHSFCADCILGYYKKNGFDRIDCPLCRKDVIALFKAFEEKQPASKIAEIREQLKDYNKKFGDDRSIKRTIKQLPFVLEKVLTYLFSSHFLLFFFSSAIFIKAMAAIIIYQVLPYDLMPASLLGSVGYVDNTLIIVLFLGFAIGQAGLQYYLNNG